MKRSRYQQIVETAHCLSQTPRHLVIPSQAFEQKDGIPVALFQVGTQPDFLVPESAAFRPQQNALQGARGGTALEPVELVEMALGSLYITGPAFGSGSNQVCLGVTRADAQIIVQHPACFLEAHFSNQLFGGAELMPSPPVKAK